jgi:hypothetical protein
MRTASRVKAARNFQLYCRVEHSTFGQERDKNKAENHHKKPLYVSAQQRGFVLNDVHA